MVECPDTPPVGYPMAYSMLDIVDNWNPDNTDIPAMHYDSLCHFDYKTEYKKAETYRNAEVPFIVYNHPEVDNVATNWGNIDYLNKRLGDKSYGTTLSKSNHFMYFRRSRSSKTAKDPYGKPWQPPTSHMESTFSRWLEGAVLGQNKSVDERQMEYFRVSSDMGNKWV